MSRFPRTSPWGEVRQYEIICKGVFAVSTEDSGGVMVRKNAADFLSPEARKLALNAPNYLCFKNGYADAVVFRELLDKNILNNLFGNKPIFEDYINKMIIENYPKYWEAREKLLSTKNKPQTLAERLEMGKQKTAAQNAERETPETSRKSKKETEH